MLRPMDKPVVGITCDFETITDRRGQPSPRYVVPGSYVSAVRRAGGIPWLLPHPEESGRGRRIRLSAPSSTRWWLQGGDFDVPPHYYGESPHPKLGRLLESRTRFESTLLQEALDRDIPVLAVCGGMQLLNVLRGGTLYQDLSLRSGTNVHEQPEDKSKPFHPLRVEAGTLLAQCLGTCDGVEVNSTHHQVVNRVGDGLVVSGTAPDGVIEAIELPKARYVLGVQWHPELLCTGSQDGIYRELVRSCSSPRA